MTALDEDSQAGTGGVDLMIVDEAVVGFEVVLRRHSGSRHGEPGSPD